MPELNEVIQNNAIDPALEKQVDDLSKDGNEEALNKALTDELSQSEDPAKKDPQPNADDDNDDPDPKDEDDDDDKGDDPSKDVKKSKADKVKDLLAARNEARDEAAEAKLENQELAKKIDDLNAKIDKLTSGNKGEDDGDDPDASTDDKPLTKAELDKYLAEREAKASEAEAAAKSNAAEVDTLIKDETKYPHAAEHKDTLIKAMARFDMNADQAYAYLKGKDVIPADNVPASNANRLNTGGQPKNNLVRDKKPEDMTDAEQEAHLRKEQAAGRLTL